MASLMDASLGGGCDALDPISKDCKLIFYNVLLRTHSTISPRAAVSK